MMAKINRLLVLTIFLSLFSEANAEAAGFSFDLGTGPDLTSRIVQMFGLITILSLAPSILIMVTSFTRIIVVFSFLRSAIGIQQSPPNSVMISLALFLTAFIMSPTFEKAYEVGVVPLMEEKITERQALEKMIDPFREFMSKHVRQQDLELFLNIAKADHNKVAYENSSLVVLIPAFMISELKKAFEIGFLLFIPFLMIDLLISAILMAMGMMMLPPVMISLPFKIIFFILIDGWYMICGSLVRSYGGG